MESYMTATEQAEAETFHQLKQENRKAEIVRVLAEGDSRTEACYAARICRQTFYTWMRVDEEFARQVRMAEEEAASLIDGVLFRCAQKAEYDPRYQRSLKLYLDRRDRREERRAEERRKKKAADRAAEARSKKAEERAKSPLGRHLAALAELDKKYAWLRDGSPPPDSVRMHAASSPEPDSSPPPRP